MSFKATVLNVLIASPSDVWKQRDEIETVINDWNRRYGEDLGIIMIPRRWEKDVAPEYRGDDPQQIINEQIVKKSDIVIGVFWTKLGTQTNNYPSGTLEEIGQFVEAGKEVLLYFVEDPLPRNGTNYEEVKRVDDFKVEYHRKGISAPYDASSISQHLYMKLKKIQISLTNSTEFEEKQDNKYDISSLIYDNIIPSEEVMILAYIKDTGNRYFDTTWNRKGITGLQIISWTEARGVFTHFLNNYSLVIESLAERKLLKLRDDKIPEKGYYMPCEIYDQLVKITSAANRTIASVVKGSSKYWND